MTSYWTEFCPRSTTRSMNLSAGPNGSKFWRTGYGRCSRTIPASLGCSRHATPLGPHSLALAEAFLAPLHEAGLPDRETGLAFSLVYDYTLGFALSSPSSVNEQRLRDAATRGKLHAFLRSLPTDQFPALVALGEYVWVDNRDQRFTSGLDTLVDGLEAARRRRRRDGSGR
jgi:Tetracyclin repressor-like, C-terminal domain